MQLKKNLKQSLDEAEKEFITEYDMTSDLFSELIRSNDIFEPSKIIVQAYKLGFMQGRRAQRDKAKEAEIEK